MVKEEVAPRTPETVQAEYAEVCRQAGDREYRIHVLQQEIDALFGVALVLNQEHVRLVKAAETAP